ncbi:MAG TPA: hypothetical protein VGL15_06440 [Vicinamibacteria bacterium]
MKAYRDRIDAAEVLADNLGYALLQKDPTHPLALQLLRQLRAER